MLCLYYCFSYFRTGVAHWLEPRTPNARFKCLVVVNVFDEVRDFAQRLVLIHSLMADERNFHHYSSFAQL